MICRDCDGLMATSAYSPNNNKPIAARQEPSVVNSIRFENLSLMHTYERLEEICVKTQAPPPRGQGH